MTLIILKSKDKMLYSSLRKSKIIKGLVNFVLPFALASGVYFSTARVVHANPTVHVEQPKERLEDKVTRRLTNNGANEGSPTWSPDGKKIAFISDRDKKSSCDQNFEIYSINPDGSDEKRLTDHPAIDMHPFWSPDGKKIGFTSQRDINLENPNILNPEVYVMDPDGRNEKRLTNHPAEDWGNSWSHDGKKILLTSDRSGNWDVYSMNVDGTGLNNLTKHSAWDMDPDWSPDSSKIVFASNRGGTYASDFRIYVMNADGSDVKKLMDDEHICIYPRWSPDGTKIAFMSERDENWDIYSINVDGTGLKKLTKSPFMDLYPDWSPDGKEIVFMSDRDGNSEIYVMRAEGEKEADLPIDIPEPEGPVFEI